jgi:pyruvate/2-oxoglutarate dehydrogenase complex dihydrolipoamide dehydrogenase (E3) component
MPNSGRTPTRPASIVVDSQCRTSDARIFAAGDVTRFAAGYVTAQPQGMIRLENWLHAQEQGRRERELCGGAVLLE